MSLIDVLMEYTISLPSSVAALISAPGLQLQDWSSVSKKLPKSPGLYAFWWVGDASVLDGDQKVQFVGPSVALDDKDAERGDGRHTSSFAIDPKDRLIDLDRTCLYVGKSTNIYQRVRQHVMLRLDSNQFLNVNKKDQPVLRTARYDEPISTVYKRNTSCQFRAGMEYLFRHRSEQEPTVVLDAIRNNVRLSYVELSNDLADYADGEDAFKRRFYWEDLLIGVLQPWFNLDGER